MSTPAECTVNFSQYASGPEKDIYSSSSSTLMSWGPGNGVTSPNDSSSSCASSPGRVFPLCITNGSRSFVPHFPVVDGDRRGRVEIDPLPVLKSENDLRILVRLRSCILRIYGEWIVRAGARCRSVRLLDPGRY